MPLESATYISDLNTSNPDGSVDLVSSLDNHVRLLKSTVKATFPNVTGAVTPTHTQLNYVTGVTSAIQTQIDAKAPLASPALTGTPTAPTPATSDSSTTIATTAQVQAAIASAAMVATTPVVPGNAGKFWTNNGSVASWGPLTAVRSARTSNTVLGVADTSQFIDITSGTFSQTFAACATLGSGWYVWLRNSGTGDITLDPNAAETIDGLATFIMYPGEARLVQCDGAVLRSVVLHPFSRTFTASGTFTTPPGYTNFGGIAWSAGASGARTASAVVVPGGAGGGAFPFTFPASVMGASQTITIGAGGLAVSAAAGCNAGGDTTIGSLLTVTGASAAGAGGAIAGWVGIASTNASGYESPSSNNNPFVSAWGGSTPGQTAAANSANAIFGGAAGGGVDATPTARNGGTSVFGGNGGNGTNGGNGIDGTAPGGGGGATRNGTLSGAGARGEVRIWGIA